MISFFPMNITAKIYSYLSIAFLFIYRLGYKRGNRYAYAKLFGGKSGYSGIQRHITYLKASYEQSKHLDWMFNLLNGRGFHILFCTVFLLKNMISPLTDWDFLFEQLANVIVCTTRCFANTEPDVQQANKTGSAKNETQHGPQVGRVVDIRTNKSDQPDGEEEDPHSTGSNLVSVSTNCHLRRYGVGQRMNTQVISAIGKTYPDHPFTKTEYNITDTTYSAPYPQLGTEEV